VIYHCTREDPGPGTKMTGDWAPYWETPFRFRCWPTVATDCTPATCTGKCHMRLSDFPGNCKTLLALIFPSRYATRHNSVIAMRGEAASCGLPVTVMGALTSRLGSGQSATPMGLRGLLSGGLPWPLHEDAWQEGEKGGGG
jgi:hypothetical protein